MSEDKKSLDAVEPPEAPETAKWLSWCWHHLHQNWMQLVKPVVLAAIVIAGLAGYQFGNSKSEDLLKLKDERAGFLGDQIAAYKDRLQGASPDQAAGQIAGLKKDFLDSEGRVQALISELDKFKESSKVLSDRVENLEPRNLSFQQVNTVISALSQTDLSNLRIRIDTDISCKDCQKFADYFASIFRSLRVHFVYASGMMFSNASRKGLELKASQEVLRTPSFSKICQALDAANIIYTKTILSDSREDNLVFRFTNKLD